MIRPGEIFYAWASDPGTREAGSSGGFVTGLLMHLLSSGDVDAVCVLCRGADIYDARVEIITDPLLLRSCSGSRYCGTISTAKFLMKYLQEHPDHRLAVVAKGCEAKAIIELSKRNRINLDNIILIGLNCSGTIHPLTARRMVAEKFGLDPDTVLNISFSEGKYHVQTDTVTKALPIEDLETEGYGRRVCCQRCDTKIPRQCDIVCGDWGVIGDYSGNTTCIEVCSKKGAQAIASSIDSGNITIEAAEQRGIEARSRVETAMKAINAKNRAEQFSKIVGDSLLQHMMRDMSRCIKCYQCTEACPMCICTDCRIKQSWLVKPGQIPPPFMFHLIRVSHIGDSCVNCGQCEDRCPMEIPNSLYLHALQVELEVMFGYHAGERAGKPVIAKMNEHEESDRNYGNTFDKMIEMFREPEGYGG